MAYVLGYFAADGSMVVNNRGAHFIEFTSTDRVLLVNVQKAIASDHVITKRPLRHSAWKQSYRLQIGSKEWFTDLQKLGFTQRKSSTLQFPRIPKRYLHDFVRGYFDGDGGVHFKQYFVKARGKKIWVFSTHFTSGCRSFLITLHEHLLKCGLRGGHISEKERGFQLVFSRRDSIALYRMMYHTTPTAGLFLPRKLKVFEKAITVLYGSSLMNDLRE